MTATGLQVLGDNGPISVPPFSSATVGPNGTISIVPLGQTPQTISNVGRIKLVNPPSDTISRSGDGLFRTSDGQPAAADSTTTLASGVLEGSNVDLAGSMVNMIELSRNFDLQIKALHAAEDNGSASAKLLQSS
jgi:flagellar basal-body rod protein FlgF